MNLRSEKYRPVIAGHETFYLRFGWLKKAYDAVAATQNDNFNVFSDDNSIAIFGVGRNMVAAIKFWAVSCGVIEFLGNFPKTTEFGDLLFSSNGLDPFLESSESLWALHWQLASNKDRTIPHWAFNYFNGGSFNKQELIKSINEFGHKSGWDPLTPKTLATDIGVFLSNYVASPNSGTPSKEDSLASPLIELGLLRAGNEGRFQFNWNYKSSLSNDIFTWALMDFWQKHSNANTLNFQSCILEPGSPGRIFLLEESEVARRLIQIEENSQGLISWSETAGLKQVIRKTVFSEKDRQKVLKVAFDRSSRGDVA